MKVTTVTATSDIHGSWDDMESPREANLLVFAGDLTADGRLQNAMAFLEWAKQFVPYFDDVVVVPGNHDRAFAVHEPLLLFEAKSRGLALLIDAGLDAHGVRVWGTPWSLTYGRWSYMDSDVNLALKYAAIDPQTELLVSHGPPYGILDKASRGVHAGSQALLDRMTELPNLRAFVCGHIHESYGSQTLKGDIFAYNVAALDNHYCVRSPGAWTHFAM